MDLAWFFVGGVAVALLIFLVWRWNSISRNPGFEEFEHMLEGQAEDLRRPSAEMDVFARDVSVKTKSPDRETAAGGARLQVPPHQHA